METIFRTFRAEVKGIDEAEGTVDMFIPMSTGAKDRVNEVILPEAFKKTLRDFRKRPVLLSSHNYNDLRKQIGEFTNIKLSDDGLLAKPKYYINEGNEEADWGFKLAQKGMAAFSVGFMPIITKEAEKDTDPLRTYEEIELLEISQVCVPANREAIQGIRAKSMDDSVISKLCDEVEKEIVTKPEETEEYIRIPVPKEEGKHGGHRIRTIDISAKEGIKALYCGECKTVITYLFQKDKGWTKEKARAWMKDHEKGVSQEALADEMDYLLREIVQVGINEDNKPLAKTLITELTRITGSDIPDKIEPEEINLVDWAKIKEPNLLDWAKSL